MTEAVPVTRRPAAAGADVPADPPPRGSGDSRALGHGRLSELVRGVLAPAASPAAAAVVTRRLAHGHYENFSVVSALLPRRLRQDFCNVYAFCRTADDLGDELGDPALASAELARLRADTRAAFAGRATSNLFVALGETIRRHDLPIDPFLDLISAFEQDQTVTRYETAAGLLDYCRRSAAPVGRLVLMMCGYRDTERLRLSDQTCTALQLVNFWQDVRRDLLDRDRVYLPAESMREFGVTEADLREQVAAGRASEAVRRVIEAEVVRATAMFDEGATLLPTLRPAVRGQVWLFGAGGRAVAAAIARQGFDTLAARPALSRSQKAKLVAMALAAAARTAAIDATIAVGRLVGRRRPHDLAAQRGGRGPVGAGIGDGGIG
jgi:squalene synthase HpnC